MDAFDFSDELGPAKVIHIHQPVLGLKAILVVDNVAAGPSIGGLRMAPDVSLKECFRLARAMTLKNAAAGLRHGGGKSVMFADPAMPIGQKEALIRAFAAAIAHETDYIVGPDMGTNEACMAWVHDEIGRSVGLPRVIGGIPLDEVGATGWGLFHAIDVAAPDAGIALDGATVVVQGYGAVGRHAARFLSEKGTRLVAASDSRGTVHDRAGLDLDRLDALKREGRSVVDYGGQALDRQAVIDIEADIWIPAARPDVIDESNVDRLRTKLVAQGANIPVSEAGERRISERGILSLPDFIANSGGVICAAMEYAGASMTAAFDTIAEKIRFNTGEVLERSKRQAVTPREAATELASSRVREAMSYRRHSIY